MEIEGVLLQNLWRGKLNPTCEKKTCHERLSSASADLTGLRRLHHLQRRWRGAVQEKKIGTSCRAGLSNRLDGGVQSLLPPKEEQACYGSALIGFANRVATCNEGRGRHKEFYTFKVEEDIVGYVHPRFAEHLRKFSDVFLWQTSGLGAGVGDSKNGTKPVKSSKQSGTSIVLAPRLSSPEDRTAAVQEVLQTLRGEGLIPGWRDELLPVMLSYEASPSLSMERAAVPFFGVKAYGVHVNGYVNVEGEKHLWIAKRSDTKQTYPGMLDHLVAGAVPEGISAKENVVKECEEEAGIPHHLAEKAVAAGAVSYEVIDGETLKRDVVFCYDLELPVDFEPFNRDGEVQCFFKQPVSEVLEMVKGNVSFKPNCALTLIDFLIRHGYITPEQKGYLSLIQSLRIGEL